MPHRASDNQNQKRGEVEVDFSNENSSLNGDDSVQEEFILKNSENDLNEKNENCRCAELAVDRCEMRTAVQFLVYVDRAEAEKRKSFA